MKKTMIVSDSNSGITQVEAIELGIRVIPMPFLIDGQEYEEDISLTQKDFYKLLEKDNVNISTSQPSSYILKELFDEILKVYEEIVFIPMSSGLSGTYETALALAEKEYQNKVFVVNNQRISVTQKESVYEAISMVNLNKTAKEIKDYLEQSKKLSSIYIMVDTLKYLKKGGRVTSAGAALGALLHIRPVLQIHGEKLDAFAKCISVKQALVKMIHQVRYDLENTYKDEYDNGKMVISVAHTNNLENALKFKEHILKEFPNVVFHFVDSLSLSISCHIGPGSLAIAISVNNYLKIE